VAGVAGSLHGALDNEVTGGFCEFGQAGQCMGDEFGDDMFHFSFLSGARAMFGEPAFYPDIFPESGQFRSEQLDRIDVD